MTLIEKYTQDSDLMTASELIETLKEISFDRKTLKSLPGYQKDSLNIKMDFDNVNADLFYGSSAETIHALIDKIRRELLPF